MFHILEKILRPSAATDITYDEALAQVKVLEEMMMDCYDSEGQPIVAKASDQEKVSRKVSKLIKQCSGEEYSWPAYEDATPELLKAIDKKWTENITEAGKTVGIWNTTLGRTNSRRSYAREVAKLFVAKRDTYINSRTRAKQWDTYAARALVLLSPLDDSKGIWPLPTASTLKEVETMLSRHSAGIKEVCIACCIISVCR